MLNREDCFDKPTAFALGSAPTESVFSARSFGPRYEKDGVAGAVSLAAHEAAGQPKQQSDLPQRSAATEELRPEDEVERLTFALSMKFEELTLIHDLSERLEIGESSAQVCQSLLNELETCLNSAVVAIDLDSDEDYQVESQLYSAGQQLDPQWIRQVAAYTTRMVDCVYQSPSAGQRVAIWNSPSESAPARVRAVVVPIQRQSKCLGRMIAIRAIDAEEFGTIEADLMKSTSMILGSHLINQRQYQEIQRMFEGTLQSLVSALDAKDAYTCGHSSRVADLAAVLAERLHYDQEGLSRIRMAGILHDIGKIGVDDAVLRKPGRLTEDEFEQIKQHPVLGYEILRGIRPFRHILPAVRHHHEAWDGTGYPDALRGEAIPRDALILAVADAFDAMTSDRPYRKGLPVEQVIEIFRDGRGTQWATDIVDALLVCPETMRAHAARDAKP